MSFQLAAAVDWLASVTEPVFFCRVTQMSLLRLLTNPKVMVEDLLTPEEAIRVYRELLGDERVSYAEKPRDTESVWLTLMTFLSQKEVSGRMPGW